MPLRLASPAVCYCWKKEINKSLGIDCTSFDKLPPIAATRKANLWSYIDARDVASCARLALESDIPGRE